MNAAERTQLLQQYRNGPLLLKEALAQVPEQIWKYKPAPNKWSVHEIVIHLADTEVQSHVRCRMILAEPGTTMMNHEEYQWSVALNYLSQDMQEALAVISIMRVANSKLIESVSESSWRQYCMHSRRGRITLEDWLKTYSEHIPQHVGQMRRNYDIWAANHREA